MAVQSEMEYTMPDEIIPPAAVTPPPAAVPPVVEPPKVDPPAPTLEEAIAEAAKWKALSRQNESKWQTTSAELKTFQDATLSDQERAVNAAKEAGRTEAVKTFGEALVKAELQVHAATAQITVPTDYLDLNRFLADDGTADTAKVKEFVDSLSKASPAQQFPALQGAGAQNGSAAQFTSMDPNELADMISGGSFI